jgi:hypothetical protein
MRETPISPEDDGIPNYADDDSSAYDLGDRPSFDDSPAALPVDDPEALPPEEIGPEEEADLSEWPPNADVASADHEAWIDSQSGIGVSDDDGDVTVEVEPVDVQPLGTTLDVAPPDTPAEDTDVTLYDVDEPGDPVGRLVESASDPVDGTAPRDNDVTAFDSNEFEGLSPEEAAMHFVEDPDKPLAS